MKALLIALLAAGIVAQAAETKMITILHTNDLHGHIRPWRGWEGELAGKTIGGFDRIAAVVNQMRAETPNVLLLDAGDALGDTMIADLTKGRAIRELMNAVGYDAMSIGNHEPEFTASELRDWIASAKFPVLAANVTRGRIEAPPDRTHLFEPLGEVVQGVVVVGPNFPRRHARREARARCAV